MWGQVVLDWSTWSPFNVSQIRDFFFWLVPKTSEYEVNYGLLCAPNGEHFKIMGTTRWSDTSLNNCTAQLHWWQVGNYLPVSCPHKLCKINFHWLCVQIFLVYCFRKENLCFFAELETVSNKSPMESLLHCFCLSFQNCTNISRDLGEKQFLISR